MSDFSLFIFVIIIGFIIGLYILINFIFSARKKNSSENNILNPEKLLKQRLKLDEELIEQSNNLQQLPIKVSKFDITPQELKNKKSISLPISTIPVLSEVITAFFPVVHDYDKLKIIFTPEMMKNFKNGTVRLMESNNKTGLRAMAVTSDGSHRILEHAKLIKHIDPALVMNASFQLASVVVAQQHMQQINQSLKQIKNRLSDIKKLHMNEYLFHARGNIDYFEVRIVPHFQSNGEFDPIIRNQAEDRFNKTMDILPNMLSLQNDESNKLDTIRKGVFFGSAFREEEFIKEAKKALEKFSDFQEIINLYFRWINEMYIPFLWACGYSDVEIKAVEARVRKFENENKGNHKAIHQKYNVWSDSFKVKIYRFNEDKYIQKNRNAVKAALPQPIDKVELPSINDGIKKPLELIVEYCDNNQMKTYLNA